MTVQHPFLVSAALAVALSMGAADSALAQASDVSAAMAAGEVGEQADGYLGVRGAASPAVRSGVEAINIKRRAAYTDLAGKRGTTVKDVAAAVGCTTLATRVAPGQAYQSADGSWRTRNGGAAVELPDYCPK